MLDAASFIFIGSIALICFIFYYLATKDDKIYKSKLLYDNNYKVAKAKKEINSNTYNSTMDIVKKAKFDLTPRQFEVFCSLLFKELGYDVELTKYEHDGGKDLILNGKIVVECKKYITQVVGREICQKILGAMHQNRAEKAIVISTGNFNYNAKEVAAMVPELELIDFYGINSMLRKIGIEKANEIIIKSLNH